MPNTRSAKKQLRVNLRRRVINRAIKSRTNTFIKKLKAAIEAKDIEGAKSFYKQTIVEIDRAVKKGVFHENKGSRYKSRLSKKFNALLKTSEES